MGGFDPSQKNPLFSFFTPTHAKPEMQGDKSDALFL